MLGCIHYNCLCILQRYYPERAGYIRQYAEWRVA